ncbi:MAG: YicC family protein [Ruminiclostridium sp.]|nr:YicC family protein [Ruminiclostridium sp.]MBQ8410749.1 YicC family protein [Ruminiclostridium sp.]
MIKSMTGFGRDRRVIGEREILVEIRSVNSRYFEFNSKLPRSFQFLEDKIKGLVKEKVSRGKVEYSLTVYNIQGKETAVAVNSLVVENYVKALREVGEKLELKDTLSLDSVFNMTDAFTIVRPEVDEEELWNAVKTVTEEAIKNFVSMRETEGEKMKADVLEKLSNIEAMIEKVCEYSPETVKAYRERLFEKMNDILEDKQISEQRILLEAGIFAEKVAIDEETVRLKSHFSQLRSMLDTDEAVGRKLDFLIQEINREINTIGSKAQDLRITGIVVDAKSEVEKIREQIQNIE